MAVTQTGHPGPLTSRTPSGSSCRSPNLAMAMVCVPQTSITVRPGRAAELSSATSPVRSSGLAIAWGVRAAGGV